MRNGVSSCWNCSKDKLYATAVLTCETCKTVWALLILERSVRSMSRGIHYLCDEMRGGSCCGWRPDSTVSGDGIDGKKVGFRIRYDCCVAPLFRSAFNVVLIRSKKSPNPARSTVFGGILTITRE
jgi:hypothetical protein